MIPGTVNARLEILIRIPILNAAAQEQEVEASARVIAGGCVQIEAIPSAADQQRP